MRRAIERAELELGWYFGEYAASVGQRAQRYDGGPGGGGGLEDFHEAPTDAQRRAAIRRAGDVERRLAGIDGLERSALVMAFEPRDWAPALRLFFWRNGARCSLVALAILSEAGIALAHKRYRASLERWEKRGAIGAMPGPESIRQTLEWYGSQQDYKALAPVRREVTASFERALGAFARAGELRDEVEL